MNTTFAAQVDSAITVEKACADFSLSRAQECAALQPLVDLLKAMPRDQANDYIRATHLGAGTYDELVVAMLLHVA